MFSLLQQLRKPFRSICLGLFALAFALTIFIGQHSAAKAFVRNQEIRGVWMTTNDTAVMRDHQKLTQAIQKLRELNFNTIYPVVWNSGYALYPSYTAQKEGFQPFIRKGLQGQDILADTIYQAHRNGLTAIPWFEFGFMTPPTSELATQHPDWLTQKKDGTKTWVGAAGEVVWLNPFKPEVQNLITSLVLEVVTQYDADGIQFDDHMSLPYEFGYDSYTKALYTKETKKPVPSNPHDPSWVKWRADKLTAFMTHLNKAVKAQKATAIFSVSPNPYEYAYKASLQDWLTWLRKDLIDELVVQVYRPDLRSFDKQLIQPEIQEARKKIPTGVGILTGLRTKPVDMNFIQTKVQTARYRKLGVSFFFYESLWNIAPESPEYRQARFRALFRTPAPRTGLFQAQQ